MFAVGLLCLVECALSGFSSSAKQLLSLRLRDPKHFFVVREQLKAAAYMALYTALTWVQSTIDYVLCQSGPSGFSRCTTACEVAARYADRARGRTFLVTGSTHGIGKATAIELAKLGGTVILASRNPELLKTVAEEMRKNIPRCKVYTIKVDLSDLQSVRLAVDEFHLLNLNGLDVLINNAGIAFCSYSTVDDVEIQMATNYLGHFLLTYLLLPDLVRAGSRMIDDKARIINLSSILHRTSPPEGIPLDDLAWKKKLFYNPFTAYGSAKLAMMLFTVELDRRLKKEDLPVTVNAVHPGGVTTGITRHFVLRPITGTIYQLVCGLFGQNIRQGAATPVYLALAPEVKDISGQYWSYCNISQWGHPSVKRDPDLPKKLWDVSCEKVGVPKELPRNLQKYVTDMYLKVA